VICLCHRNQKSSARVRSRSRLRRRPCLKEGARPIDGVVIGYPKNGFIIDVDDIQEGEATVGEIGAGARVSAGVSGNS